MDDSDLGMVYFYLHGSAGRIIFDEVNGDYISNSEDNGVATFDSFQSKKIKNALYMFNCNGAKAKNGENIAEYFAQLCKTNVFACVCGVSFTKLPFSQRTQAREEKKEFLNPFSFNWKLFRYTNDGIIEYTLISKWLN